MSEDTRKIIPAEHQNQNGELTDEQLDHVTGGEMLTAHLPFRFIKCAVNPQHRWPFGCEACPECGSTEFTCETQPN